MRNSRLVSVEIGTSVEKSNEEAFSLSTARLIEGL